MARRDSVTARKTTRQSLKLPHQGHLCASIFRTRLTSKGKRPQRIKKEQEQSPLRRSARLDRLIEINETQQNPSWQPEVLRADRRQRQRRRRLLATSRRVAPATMTTRSPAT
ncbi:uncharacterized protein Z519_12637 [Cladophialophora bantiana CBS 173.52]|uniref:Uncharacterized protein n=1 Tax=Cladophialophora bantiana (strain ATCC 10958 / CBS 173.52 / CDC B-1940 / NIH 8579) TaxID=1442370 RepID=A0A0D2HQL2_CLAB1|nr:uncharacterized protein Z519_12637 [Cladophialophora bantiana CBS 173.52]KIW86724.1 hypothetical protein Z519_12637 [Cladophialophora bantiana CBS 173.52]